MACAGLVAARRFLDAGSQCSELLMTDNVRLEHALSLLQDHGGRPDSVAQALAIPRSDLLDLSNAVSPFPYPLGTIPEHLLTELPYERASLAEVASDFYGVASGCVLAASGSQHLIQSLPRMRGHSTVLLPRLGYEEHLRWWRAAGHRCVFYDEPERDLLMRTIRQEKADVLVLIHPNNPTGSCIEHADIAAWRTLLPDDGQIVVDEAFVDVQPEKSLSTLLPMAGLLILRSAGKFFGLPGLRLGFLLASEATIREMRAQLGPWAINAIAQWAGERMLVDAAWQQRARERLRERAQAQYESIINAGLSTDRCVQTPYFTSISLAHDQAEQLLPAMLARHISLRCYAQHPDYACIRIGLTASEHEQWRLQAALSESMLSLGDNIQEGLSSGAI